MVNNTIGLGHSLVAVPSLSVTVTVASVFNESFKTRNIRGGRALLLVLYDALSKDTVTATKQQNKLYKPV